MANPDARTTPLKYAAGAGVLVLGLIPLWHAAEWQFAPVTALERIRNFYGVIKVEEWYADDPQRHHYTFRSERITHGKQYQAAGKRDIPLTYYGRQSGVGRALVAAGDRGPLRVAAVGLGTGTLATYGVPEITIASTKSTRPSSARHESGSRSWPTAAAPSKWSRGTRGSCWSVKRRLPTM